MLLSMVLVISAIAASYCLLTRAAVSVAMRSAVSVATFWMSAVVLTAWAPASAARPTGDRRAAVATGVAAGGVAFLVGAAFLAGAFFAAAWVAVFFAGAFFAAAWVAVFFAGAFFAAVSWWLRGPSWPRSSWQPSS